MYDSLNVPWVKFGDIIVANSAAIILSWYNMCHYFRVSWHISFCDQLLHVNILNVFQELSTFCVFAPTMRKQYFPNSQLPHLLLCSPKRSIFSYLTDINLLTKLLSLFKAWYRLIVLKVSLTHINQSFNVALWKRSRLRTVVLCLR